MRTFELLLTLVNAAALLSGLVDFLPTTQRHNAARVSVLLAAVQLVWEGFRWQLWPLYLVTIALAVTLVWRDFAPPRWLDGALLGLLVIGTALAVALPVPRLPDPGGPFEIGTVTYHWVDPSRPEIYGETPSGNRELMVQIWYPAGVPRGASPAPWLEAGRPLARAIAEWGRLPGFLLQQLTFVETHAYPDAPLMRSAPYPVVLYLHGWGGFRNINQDQLEALASRGYVVAAADHVYGSLLTVYPDGRLVYNDPVAMNGAGGDAEFARASNVLMETYAADAAFVLDQLTALNSADPDGRFNGELDLARVGVFGHSTGGGAMVHLCATDDRCGAALGMDTWVVPLDEEIRARNFSQPVLLLNSAAWLEHPNRALLRPFYERAAGPAYWLDLADSVHYDFTLVPLFSPIGSWLGVRGPLPAQRALEINTAYLVAFFDAYLKDAPSPLLNGPAPTYPEVTFERR